MNGFIIRIEYKEGLKLLQFIKKYRKKDFNNDWAGYSGKNEETIVVIFLKNSTNKNYFYKQGKAASFNEFKSITARNKNYIAINFIEDKKNIKTKLLKIIKAYENSN